jgi:hypothetical protein
VKVQGKVSMFLTLLNLNFVENVGLKFLAWVNSIHMQMMSFLT